MTARAPRVSVLVPTHNRPDLLREALASLAAQSFTDLEVVVVNDGGRDVSAVVDEFHPHLRTVLVDNPVNLGRAGACNRALSAARGDLVGFLDDDDVLYPHHVRTLVDAHEGGLAECVYSFALKTQLDETGRAVRREVVGDQVFDANLLRVTNFIVGMTALAPASAVREVGGLDEELRVLEDWDLWMRVSARHTFAHVPVPTAEYRWRPGTANQTVREWFRFDHALRHVYGKSPLAPGSPLAPLRQRMLDGSRERAEHRAFETSFLVACAGDDHAGLVRTLESVVECAVDDSYEVLLLVPEAEPYEELLTALEGDVQVYAVGHQDVDAVWRFGRSRAGGRRMVELRAGDRCAVTA